MLRVLLGYKSTSVLSSVVGLIRTSSTRAVSIDEHGEVIGHRCRTAGMQASTLHINLASVIPNYFNGHLSSHSPVLITVKGECSVFKKKIIMDESDALPNTIRSHLVTIVPLAPFTPNSTSKWRSSLHIRYSIVIPRFISRANTAQS